MSVHHVMRFIHQACANSCSEARFELITSGMCGDWGYHEFANEIDCAEGACETWVEAYYCASRTTEGVIEWESSPRGYFIEYGELTLNTVGGPATANAPVICQLEVI